jgi:hypothetical protein
MHRVSATCTMSDFFFQWLFQPIQGPGLLFSSVIIFTDSTTPWTSDQPVAMPLSKHRTTQTQNKRIQTSNIHALIGIRIHDPSVRASEDSLCLRPRGYCDQLPSPIRETKLCNRGLMVYERGHRTLIYTWQLNSFYILCQNKGSNDIISKFIKYHSTLHQQCH